MKISIELAKLIEVVEIAARFVSKNSTLPILQNLYLKASIDTLTLKATDMEKYVEIEVPCAIALEGAITVNAKMFLDLLKVMEEETIEISLNAQSQQIQLRSSKDTFDLNGISAGEYVALPEVPQTNTVVLDTQTFLQGIDHVEYTITEKNFSPVLTGVLVKTKTEATGKKMVFVGTDSFRIAEFKLNSQVDADFSLIIPKVAINDMRSITKFAIESELPEMTMKFSENLVAFEYQIGTTKIVATTLLIQGAFPDYEREEIIPTHFNTTILVDKTLCEKAIKKIWILTKDINNYIQVETQTDGIIISSGGKSDKGAGITKINAIVEGEMLTFALNGRYITDFIKVMDSAELSFQMVDHQKPMIITDKGNEAYKYVVRPLINN